MKVALYPARGIGDALIMMIAAHHFHSEGAEVTIYHDQIGALSAWFPFYKFAPFSTDNLSYDHIILQNDNTERSKTLITQAYSQLSIIYPSYESRKHPPLRAQDMVCDFKETFVTNLSRHFGTQGETGLLPPSSLIKGKYKKRIILHPLSAASHKNWPRAKFLKVAHLLKDKGYEPVFMVAPPERSLFPESPLFSSISDAAAFLYESEGLIGNDSALGHLASLFDLPTVTIGRNPKELAFWRPGWRKGRLVTPPRFIPNLKGLRLREKYWPHFIPNRSPVENLLIELL